MRVRVRMEEDEDGGAAQEVGGEMQDYNFATDF